MGIYFNPNRGTNGVPNTGSAGKSNKGMAAKETAVKVNQVVKTPVNREVTGLGAVRGLAQRIQNQWNELSPGELAEMIIDLEGRVALLEGNSPQEEKMRNLAERLHFQFVFPIAREFLRKPEVGMPDSFARAIDQIANQILKTQSLEPMKQLNAMQMDQIMQIAVKGGA